VSDLFRKEVVDKQGQKLFGDVVLSSPISHKAVTALLAVIILGLVTFSIVGEYARKERVIGYLTPDQGLIRIMPRQVGLIERGFVQIGDSVEKGDPLFSLIIDTTSASGVAVAGQLLEQLELEKQQLLERRDLIPRQYNLSKNRLRSQIAAAQSEASRLDERINLQQKTVANEQIVFEKFSQLIAQEAASALEASSQENRLLQATQSLALLRNEQQRFLDQVADLQAQMRLLPISEQQDISDITSQLSALQQRMTQTAGQESYMITAPVAGRIASITGREGQMATGQAAMATLLPKGGKLEAQLLVPSRAAGFVDEGQTVRLLYDAFPYQKFGFHTGVVSDVSRTVISSTDLPIAPPTQEPVFLITVDLGRQDVDANNQLYALQSGMTLSADIVLEDRKIWEWVFEPLLGAAEK
jgi:membrane fusion protein